MASEFGARKLLCPSLLPVRGAAAVPEVGARKLLCHKICMPEAGVVPEFGARKLRLRFLHKKHENEVPKSGVPEVCTVKRWRARKLCARTWCRIEPEFSVTSISGTVPGIVALPRTVHHSTSPYQAP